jgi:hypothetical protein
MKIKLKDAEKKDIMIRSLSGEVVKDENGAPLSAGRMFSTILANQRTGDARKFYALSEKFFAKDEVELDAADFKTVETSVSESQQPAFIRGPLLAILDKAR